MALFWIIVILIVLAYASEFYDKFVGEKKNDSLSNIDTKEEKASFDLADFKTKNPSNKRNNLDFYDTTIIEDNEAKPTVVNNYYVQNNVYIQQNNYHNKSEDENKDHSEEVWKRLGYKVKYGETYSYKFYGNKIFKPNQVERIGSNHVKYSESGLVRKLLNDTGSKNHTKNILVNNYGVSESKAKKLLYNID